MIRDNVKSGSGNLNLIENYYICKYFIWKRDDELDKNNRTRGYPVTKIDTALRGGFPGKREKGYQAIETLDS